MRPIHSTLDLDPSSGPFGLSVKHPMLMSHPETDTCSPSLCWGKEEHTESAHVPLMIGTVVSPDPETPVFETISPHVSRLMAVETCHLPSLTSNSDLTLALLVVALPLKSSWNRSPLLLSRA